MICVIAGLAIPTPAAAANVSGSLSGANGQRMVNEQVHFEDSVTHDVFLVMTGADGKFSIDLPACRYDLRTDRGIEIARGIAVGETDLALGPVREPAVMHWINPFQSEGVARAIVTTPAPSTADIPAIEQPAGESGAAAAASAASGEPPQGSGPTAAK